MIFLAKIHIMHVHELCKYKYQSVDYQDRELDVILLLLSVVPNLHD